MFNMLRKKGSGTAASLSVLAQVGVAALVYATGVSGVTLKPMLKHGANVIDDTVQLSLTPNPDGLVSAQLKLKVNTSSNPGNVQSTEQLPPAPPATGPAGSQPATARRRPCGNGLSVLRRHDEQSRSGAGGRATLARAPARHRAP